MKFKFLLLSLLGLSSISVSAQSSKSTASVKSTSLARPKLMVGIMVDQMRWDYLYRFYDRYGSGGFKRMLNEGFSCENTYINYSPSVTGIGHTTVYTGSVPAIHGIAGNDFIVQATGKTLYCAGDSTVQTVGSSNASVGKMSPRNMQATTVTDELRLATNFRSKVIAIASKDRGSILPGGHNANAAYWYDGSSGNWVTSTYYMQELPTWANAFNNQKLAEKYLKQDWNTLYPIDTYLQSTPDDNKYEGKIGSSQKPVFPVKTSEMYGKSYGMITSTPYGSTLTLEMAKAAVEGEALGADAITDFLAVSVSSPDYVGHMFGPNSVEVEDTYLRLDRDLAAFFTYLDTKVGKGNYSVFLTADHAAQNNSNFLRDNRMPSGLISTGKIMGGLNDVLEKEYKEKGLVKSLMNYSVNFNQPLIADKKLDQEAIKKTTIDYLRKQEGINFVFDMDDIQSATIPVWMREQVTNGYNRERSGSIQMVLKPGWYSGGQTGASHGTLNPADTHIPLLFMGWGIRQGKSNNRYDMTDIAPTVAGLLKIQEPSGNIGTPINEVLK